jgi:hypothetical protein
MCLVMGLSALVAVSAPAQAFPALQPPFQAGVRWYVCQGYNGGPSHSGDPALDMTTDPNRGPNGCYGDANHASGKPVFAPASGRLDNLNNGYGGVCITFADNSSMYLGHLSNRRGTGPVSQGEQIGTVAPAGAEANGGYAHVHLSARSGPGCGGTKVPFSGSARFAGAPEMTNNGTPNQWAGTSMVRTGGGVLRGSFDSSTSPAPGQLRVTGWAFDEDAKTTAVGIHVYVGGPAGDPNARGLDIGPANVSRPDVGTAYPGVGNHHGFDKTIEVSRFGAQPVYVYAINVPGTPGGNQLIASKTVSVANPNPFGSLDELSTPAPGLVRVRGWAADPSSPTSALAVHIYAGSTYLRSITANGSRPDVGKAFPGYGDWHGYDATIPAPSGSIRVCTFGINVGVGNNNTELGCRTVAVVADTAPPETTLTAAPPSVHDSTSVSFSFTSSEGGSTFTCQVDGGAWAACTSPVAYSAALGDHTFAVRARDAAGNVDPTPAVVGYRVTDLVAPPPPPPAAAPDPAPAQASTAIALSATAVRNSSRIKVDLGPDSSLRDYHFRLQRRADGRWRTVRRSATKGSRDVRVLDMRRGRYRVVVPAQLGLTGAKATVRLRR